MVFRFSVLVVLLGFGASFAEGRSIRLKRHPHPPGTGTALSGIGGFIQPGGLYQAGNFNEQGFVNRETNPTLAGLPQSNQRNPYLYSPVNVPRDSNVFPNDARFYDPLLPLPNDPSFNYGVDVDSGNSYNFDGNIAFTAVNELKTEYYPFDAGLDFKVIRDQFATTGRSLTKSKVHDEILDSLAPLNTQVNPINPAGYPDEIFYPYPLLQGNQAARRTTVQRTQPNQPKQQQQQRQQQILLQQQQQRQLQLQQQQQQQLQLQRQREILNPSQNTGNVFFPKRGGAPATS